jgi:hypothetical protein
LVEFTNGKIPFFIFGKISLRDVLGGFGTKEEVKGRFS